MSISFHSWMLSNIWNREGQSFVLFQYQLCYDYSVLFTALIFSVGTWCPEEGNSTKVYCIITIINHDYDYNSIYIYIYIYIYNHS